MKKILILGSGGYIGSQMYTFFSQLNTFVVVGLDLVDAPTVDIVCDLLDTHYFSNILLELKPDIIIHSAAVKDLLICEQNREYAWNVNAHSCYTLSDFAKNNNTKIIYISSDVVFDGEKGDYLESDYPFPINVYGLTKLCGELILKHMPCSSICRTALVIGNLTEKYQSVLEKSLESNNLSNQTLLPHYLYNKLKRNEEVSLADGYISSPTSTLLLFDGIFSIIQNNYSGVFHLAGTTALSRYEFGLKLAEFHGFNKNLIIKITQETMSFRPRNLSMNVDNTFQQLGLMKDVYNLDTVFKTIKWVTI